MEGFGFCFFPHPSDLARFPLSAKCGSAVQGSTLLLSWLYESNENAGKMTLGFSCVFLTHFCGLSAGFYGGSSISCVWRQSAVETSLVAVFPTECEGENVIN